MNTTKQFLAIAGAIVGIVLMAIFLPKIFSNKNQTGQAIDSQTQKSCIIAGCSGELCVEEGSGNTASSCIWNDSYACYKTAKCERQTNGACGWTETTELKLCLQGDLNILPDK